MQKLKENVINRMLSGKLTSAEVNFIIHISHYQDVTGSVVGIHYKDICDAIDISYQTFYDVIRNLEQKQFIRTDREYSGEWNIQILGNDFTGYELEQDKESYLSTGHDIFQEKSFLKLKANEKLLAMHFLKIAGANQSVLKRGRGKYCISVEKFYEQYCRLLTVTKRVLQRYLTSLRRFFHVGIKEFKYWITPRSKVFKTPLQPGDMDHMKYHMRRILCRRNKLAAADAASELKDTVDLLEQYKKYPDVAYRLLRAIEKSTCGRNGKEKRKLRPSFIHKLLREELQQYSRKVPVWE